jgi:hypothetical protein
MDNPKPPISPLDPNRRVGADAAPITGDDRRLDVPNDLVVVSSRDHVESLANRVREGSHALYCESEEEVSEGFAIALRIMGLEQS